MQNLIVSLIVAVAVFLMGCAPASQETNLPTPMPTEAPLHCSPNDKPLITEQVAYKGMSAGQTSLDEVKVIFGEPTDNIGATFWFESEDPVFWITFEDEIIDEIQMLGDFPLQDLLTTYGCPNIFTHNEPNSFGSVDEIYFVYLNAGVYFFYPGERIFAGLDVDDIIYFPPMGEEEFFNRNPSLERDNPMTWDTFYIDCPGPFGDCSSP